MVILDVFSNNLTIKYKARLCSKAVLFVLFFGGVSIIVPFLLAYNSRGFWLTHKSFYEQPNIKLKGKYMLVAITNNLRYPIICSNYKYLQQFSNFDKCSLIKIREIDNNKDGKFDEFYISFNVLLEELKITSISLILTLDYSLETLCPLQMQSSLIFNHNLQVSVSEINIAANLQLAQASAIQCYSYKRHNIYNSSCLSNLNDLSSYDVSNIINCYSHRNISTHLKNKYITYKTDNKKAELLLTLNVHYPEQKVYYIPNFWQIMKWAWIQYFAIYVICAWLINKLKSYIFENNLLLFYKISPLTKLD